MALYSVWDWDRNAYRVYRTRTPVSVGDDPIPPKPRSSSPIGADPDTQIKALPAGAQPIGFSHIARGEIRRTGGALGGDDGGSSSRWAWVAAGVAAGAVGTYWWIRRRR